MKPYYGCGYWHWRMGRGAKKRSGSLTLTVPTSNRREDELFARYLLRLELGVKRLPQGTHVWPATDGN